MFFDILKKYEYRIMDSLLKKAIGLMFMKKNNIIFIFENSKEKKIAIHSFFCEPLYLYFFDKDGNLVEKTFLKPFRIYFPKKSWKYLIESFKKIKELEENV